MKKKNQEWTQEQQRVDDIIRKIQQKQKELHTDRAQAEKEMMTIRKNFWEDVTVNLEDATEALETATSLRQQAEVLSERERRVQHAEKEMDLLRKLADSPYFARIDFQEEGETKPEPIYLGIGSFYDEKKDEFLIYDWRAPISSLYYDFPPGPATYSTPSGTIQGTLKRKRQFVIKRGKIESLFDTGVTIGDELLRTILGKHAEPHMKNIVATIQREQNQIIRDHQSPVVVVQGVAGSGKTSVAMQRIAYLLYRYRGHLHTDQMLLFSPNFMFQSYISTVLPELGEENIQQTTFQEYLESKLSKTFRIEDPFDQMESLLGPVTNQHEIRRKGIIFKSSPAYLKLLETYLSQLIETGMIFHDIVFRDETVLSAKEIESYFYSLTEINKIPHRLEQTQSWLLQQLKKWEQEERTKPWVEKAIDYLDEKTYDRVYQWLQKRRKNVSFVQLRYELAKVVVKKQLAPLKRWIKEFKFVNSRAIYQQLFTEAKEWTHRLPNLKLPDEWEAICRQSLAKMDQGELFYEDATPYLYLTERLKGFETNNTIRHLIIDEAQDYSSFQFAVLRRLFPRSKFTILGDLNQAIFPHADEKSDWFSSIHVPFHDLAIKRYTLNKSYRSTVEILTFAQQLIQGKTEIIPFERHGKKPTLAIYKNEDDRYQAMAHQIRQLKDEGHESIAILCKTNSEAIEVAEILSNQHHINVQRLHKHSPSFQQGVVVLPAYLAKGIEFDGVLIADAAKYQHEWERKLFYTACTRAMHTLSLYASDETNPFLQDVSAADYHVQA